MIHDVAGGEHSWVETADGIPLSVWEWGDAAGPALLLVHGQAQCHLSWAPQIAAPALRGCRLVAFDLRGHGDSGKPPGAAPYREPARFGDDIARVVAATALRRPVVAGWSMGGRSLREYLLLHGDAGLGAINFVGARVLERPEFAPPRLAFRAEGGVVPLRTRIEETAGFLRQCYHRQPDPETFAFSLAFNMLVSMEARGGIATWPQEPAAADRMLRGLTRPVLVSQGLEDRIVPVAASRAVAEAAPGARLSLYPECGHSPFQEDAERFNAELATLVEEAR